MQGQQQPSATAGEWRTRGVRAADLGCAGEEDQDMAGKAARGQAFQGGGYLLFERRGGVRRVLDFERILAALGAYDAGAAQVLRHGSGVECGGHDQQAEVGTFGPLETAQ